MGREEGGSTPVVGALTARGALIAGRAGPEAAPGVLVIDAALQAAVKDVTAI